MLDLSLAELVTLVVILPLAGGIAGYMIALERMKKRAGGRSLAELQQAQHDYQAEVAAHFARTAELVRSLSGDYASLCAHLARGASEFSPGAAPDPQVEQLRRLSVALVGHERGAQGSAVGAAESAQSGAVDPRA